MRVAITLTACKKKFEQSLKNCRSKKNFTKQFAKTTIPRIAKDIRVEFHRQRKVKNSESVEKPVDDVDSLLQPANHVCELETLKSVSVGKCMAFTKAPEILPDVLRRKTPLTTEYDSPHNTTLFILYYIYI